MVEAVLLTDSVAGLVARPLAGGPDRSFNTRWADVQVGVTKPSASNTGVRPGIALTPTLGWTNTVPGIYQNLDISGRFINQAPGLTVLYNCKVHWDVFSGFTTGVVDNSGNPYKGQLMLVDCEIYCTVSQWLVTGVTGMNITAIRCKTHDVVDQYQVATDPDDPDGPVNVHLQACYGYDLLYYSPDPTHASTDNRTHNDFCQITAGSGLIVEGCYSQMTQSALSYNDPVTGFPSDGKIGQSFTITPTNGATRDFQIINNWSDYGIRGFIAEGTASLITGGLVSGNRFGDHFLQDPTNFYGPMVSRHTFDINYVNNTNSDGSTTPILWRS